MFNMAFNKTSLEDNFLNRGEHTGVDLRRSRLVFSRRFSVEKCKALIMSIFFVMVPVTSSFIITFKISSSFLV